MPSAYHIPEIIKAEREKGEWEPLMGPPSGHLFYSRGMAVLKPPIGIPANSAGNAEISEQRRARWLGF